MNSEFCRSALAKVGNPNVLINLISRRVRQLNAGGGAYSRPLVANASANSATDIALRELIEDKIGWETPEETALIEPKSKKRRKKR